MATDPRPTVKPAVPPGGGVINQPVAYAGDAPAKPLEPSGFTREEIKGLAGDLKHGEVGVVELDDQGTPKTARRLEDVAHEPGKPVANVIGVEPYKYDEVVTPSGAPLTKHMNPNPELWDAGMLARNPPPKDDTSKNGNRRVAG
jgi:hypothetical protein